MQHTRFSHNLSSSETKFISHIDISPWLGFIHPRTKVQTWTAKTEQPTYIPFHVERQTRYTRGITPGASERQLVAEAPGTYFRDNRLTRARDRNNRIWTPPSLSVHTRMKRRNEGPYRPIFRAIQSRDIWRIRGAPAVHTRARGRDPISTAKPWPGCRAPLLLPRITRLLVVSLHPMHPEM